MSAVQIQTSRAALSAFAEYAFGLGWAPDDAILMIWAYFDDSGDPGDPHDRTLTIAGGVATTDAWSRWAQDWAHLLEDFGVAWFHTVDFEHLRDQFKQWSAERKESFRARLLSIVRRHIDQGARAVGCVVPHDYVPREERARRGTARGLDPVAAWSLIEDDPWFVCLTWCIYAASRLSPDGRIHVVFAQKSKLSGKAAEYFSDIILHAPKLESRFRGLNFLGEPRNLLPLQMADLVAWHLRRYNSRLHGGERPREEYSVLRRHAWFHKADPPRMFEGWLAWIQDS